MDEYNVLPMENRAKPSVSIYPMSQIYKRLIWIVPHFDIGLIATRSIKTSVEIENHFGIFYSLLALKSTICKAQPNKYLSSSRRLNKTMTLIIEINYCKHGDGEDSAGCQSGLFGWRDLND